MSLKAFHVVFVAASVILMVFLSGWCFANYRESGSGGDLLWSVLSALAVVTLIIYGRYFLKKLRNISYL